MIGKDWENNWIEWGNNPRKRRGRLHIMAEILYVAKEGALKTQIMYRANLSFAQLNDYLSLLLDLDLLKAITNDGRTSYKATKKGLDFIENYKDVLRLVKKDNGNCLRPRSSSATW